MIINNIKLISILVVLFPLFGAIIAGFFGKLIGKKGAHSITILGVSASFILSCLIANAVLFNNAPVFDGTIYHWAISGDIAFDVGFLIDKLTVVMMCVVTFVSLLVHLYSIGYMAEDPGYQRFFAYISLFTFAMLNLVMANNFMLLFFGWEAVGLVSYLLIGFWFTRESAVFSNLKAFLVNRVGDMGFILGIGGVLTYFGSVHYQDVFNSVQQLTAVPQMTFFPGGNSYSVITVICILLFIGAMGKSAQIPLHVWLPESMEGPTPISALIHAATMVTAGIFMVSRMSPLFEHSQAALSFVIVIGASTALFTGLIGIVQNDIKRVVAYSTLSQLGYMMTALGASAYSVGVFHLVTHACFKALLFLAAGSVIMGMHHEQDMRKMGNLRKYMPVTYIMFLIGSLALSGIPPFAGFYSKDLLIEAVQASHIPGAGFAYFCVLAGVFVTALYTFRAFFLTFHTKERMDKKTQSHIHESPWVVTLPLILLAIPSVILGAMLIKPVLSQEQGFFGNSIFVLAQNNVLEEISAHFHGAGAMALHAVFSAPFWLALSGILFAWFFNVKAPSLKDAFVKKTSFLYRVLANKYGFDDFNQIVIVGGIRALGGLLYRIGDVRIIDGYIVNGLGRLITSLSQKMRFLQSGYLYHYTFIMVLGLFGLLYWFAI